MKIASSQSNYNHNVQFEALSDLMRASKFRRKESAEFISNVLDREGSEVLKLTKNASNKRIDFFLHLAERYNQFNFYRDLKNKEDAELVNKIFKMVKFPIEAHEYLLSNFSGSLDSLYRIFANTNNKFKSLNFAKKVNLEILSNHPNSYLDLLPELLESPNKSEYMKNYSKYKTYLILNRKDKNVIKNLDEMVQNGTFSEEKYQELYNNQNYQAQFNLPHTEGFSAEDYAKNYSIPGKDFLEYMAGNFFLSKEFLTFGANEVLLDMYKSVTDKNLQLRKDITEIFSKIKVSRKNPELQLKQLKELNQLYKMIDKDEDAKKFIQYFVDNPPADPVSINSINKVLLAVPTKKLSIFRDNAKKIIAKTRGKERIEALLSDLENPFFETEKSIQGRKISEKYGFTKPQTKFQKFILSVKNEINIRRYDKYRNLEPEVCVDDLCLEDEIFDDAANKISLKASEDLPKETISENENPKIKEFVKKVKAILTSSPDYRSLAESYIKLKPSRSKHNENQLLYSEIFDRELLAPQMKSLVEKLGKHLERTADISKVIENQIPKETDATQYSLRQKELEKVFSSKNMTKQDVLSYVQKKLGAKTLSAQKDAYRLNATKMKLNMLPEIFASISDTRKADRAVGKARINSSNKDALELYLLINGNNKKYINYLLKKRNSDNTRMFEVKDIINMVKAAEQKINEQKRLNPEYRSLDAKNYYNHLYDAKIQQYGKVEKTKKHGQKI